MKSPSRIVETAPPGAEPVTLDDLKNHLRLGHDADNMLLTELIATARQICEQFIGCALITRSYSLFLDQWPGKESAVWWDGLREGVRVSSPSILELPFPPLVSVTKINIHAEDGSSTEYPAASYFSDISGFPGRIILKSAVTPPFSDKPVGGIEIQFKAGYGATPERVPAALRQGIRMLAAHLYANRGDDSQAAMAASGAHGLFQPFRKMGLT